MDLFTKSNSSVKADVFSLIFLGTLSFHPRFGYSIYFYPTNHKIFNKIKGLHINTISIVQVHFKSPSPTSLLYLIQYSPFTFPVTPKGLDSYLQILKTYLDIFSYSCFLRNATWGMNGLHAGKCSKIQRLIK